MFAVARYFPAKEAEKAFRLFIAWLVRFSIAGRNTGALDRQYALRAQEVGLEQITTAKQLVDAMKDIVPPDEEFQVAFGEARLTNSNFARYLLRAMEMQHHGETEPEFVPNDEREIVTLEHVLPQNPGADWPEIDPSDAEVYSKRLGNMVLLTASKNSVIGNSPFAAKKPHLAACAFALTKGVGRKNSWGLKEIKERQKQLASLAVTTWPITVK
jgi:hypothetical protein